MNFAHALPLLFCFHVRTIDIGKESGRAGRSRNRSKIVAGAENSLVSTAFTFAIRPAHSLMKNIKSEYVELCFDMAWCLNKHRELCLVCPQDIGKMPSPVVFIRFISHSFLHQMHVFDSVLIL
jgi:hypothetical protein